MGIAPEVIPGTHILCSGFWGWSRHINYMGEIIQVTFPCQHCHPLSCPRVQGFALALPGVLATGSLLPLAYPLYYIALMVPRQFEVR